MAATATTTIGARELTRRTIKPIPVATGQLRTLLSDQTLLARAKTQPTSGHLWISRTTVRRSPINSGNIISMRSEARSSTHTVGEPNRCNIKGMEVELEDEGVEHLEGIIKGNPREISIETDCR